MKLTKTTALSGESIMGNLTLWFSGTALSISREGNGKVWLNLQELDWLVKELNDLCEQKGAEDQADKNGS